MPSRRQSTLVPGCSTSSQSLAYSARGFYQSVLNSWRHVQQRYLPFTGREMVLWTRRQWSLAKLLETLVQKCLNEYRGGTPSRHTSAAASFDIISFKSSEY